jgi:hypothetical protein
MQKSSGQSAEGSQQLKVYDSTFKVANAKRETRNPKLLNDN